MKAMSSISAEMENELRRKAAELHDGGLGYRKIAKQLGVQPEKAKYWIQRYRLYGEVSFVRYRHHSSYQEPGSPSLTAYENALADCDNPLVPIAKVAKMHGLDYNRLYYYIATKRPDILTTRRLVVKKHG